MAARTPSATSACDIVAETTSPPPLLTCTDRSNLVRRVIGGRTSWGRSRRSTRSRMRCSSRIERPRSATTRLDEHTSELQSLMRISYAALRLHKKTHHEVLHQDDDPHQRGHQR